MQLDEFFNYLIQFEQSNVRYRIEQTKNGEYVLDLRDNYEPYLTHCRITLAELLDDSAKSKMLNILEQTSINRLKRLERKAKKQKALDKLTEEEKDLLNL